MKRSTILTLLSLLMISGLYNIVYAQSPQFSIFDSFNAPAKPGEGRVVIHQSEEIKQLIGTRIDSENIDIINGKTFLITMGYRIQVYSGNLQQKSREEAESLQRQITKLFPEITSYVGYNAPFWKLHVGDYRSFEEASLMLRELRSAYPQKRNEIYILEDNIRLPLDQ